MESTSLLGVLESLLRIAIIVGVPVTFRCFPGVAGAFVGCWFGGAVWGFGADIRVVSVAYWDLPTKNRGLPTIIGICRQKFRITNNFSDLPTKINHLPTILQKSTNFTRSLLHGNAACQMTNCRRDGQTFSSVLTPGI